MSTPHVVLVADTDIDAHGNADPDVRGPFPSQEAAEHYAVHVGRYNVQVLPILDPTLLQDGMVTEHEPWCNHDPAALTEVTVMRCECGAILRDRPDEPECRRCADHDPRDRRDHGHLPDRLYGPTARPYRYCQWCEADTDLDDTECPESTDRQHRVITSHPERP